jgi:uncharacterized membrane protein YjjP (DUF1212 family)
MQRQITHKQSYLRGVFSWDSDLEEPESVSSYLVLLVMVATANSCLCWLSHRSIW